MTTSANDLTDAVGFFQGVRCTNHAADVQLVKKLLNARAKQIGLAPPLDVNDPRCGDRTRKAIEDFQRIVMRKGPPYGRVLPKSKGGATFEALLGTPAGNNNEWAGEPERWPQDKKLRSLNPLFRQKVDTVMAALRKRGFQPTIFYGWRSVAVQLELYKKGRTKVKFSFHNAQKKDGTPNAYAADIVDTRWSWTPAAQANGFWKALGEDAKAAGLVWGGAWTTFPDLAHVQYYPNSSLALVKKESGL